MTPCEQRGYKFGDEFIVIGEDAAFDHGTLVWLSWDDGSHAPMFSVLAQVFKDGVERTCTEYVDGAWITAFVHLSDVVPHCNVDLGDVRAVDEWLRSAS